MPTGEDPDSLPAEGAEGTTCEGAKGATGEERGGEIWVLSPTFPRLCVSPSLSF